MKIFFAISILASMPALSLDLECTFTDIVEFKNGSNYPQSLKSPINLKIKENLSYPDQSKMKIDGNSSSVAWKYNDKHSSRSLTIYYSDTGRKLNIVHKNHENTLLAGKHKAFYVIGTKENNRNLGGECEINNPKK